MDCLIIRLAAPLMSWGGDQVDGTVAPSHRFPALSMAVGLIGNALGLERHDSRRHQELQDDIIFACRIDREPTGPNLVDLQTSEIGADDRGWTTRGIPEGRAGARETYENRNISEMEYLQDAVATMAIAVAPGSHAPDTQEIAAALQGPFRTLFIGRKPCVPSGQLYVRILQAPDPLHALLHAPLAEGTAHQATVRLQWTSDSRSRNQIQHGGKSMQTQTISAQGKDQTKAGNAARPDKAAIAAAIGMPALALSNSTMKLSDLVNMPRYEIERER